MIEKRTVQVPAKEHTEKRVVCDLCGAAAGWGDFWNRETFSHQETRIFCRSVVSYPENGSDETTEFDVCPECFQSKVTPALKAIGLSVRQEESYW